MSDPDKFGLTLPIYKMVATSPWSLLLLVGFITFLFTRIRTGSQSKQQATSKGAAKEIVLVPYWIPWLAHSLSFLLRYQNYLVDASKTVKDGVFRLSFMGEMFNIVLTPSVAKQVLLQRSTTSSADHVFLFMERALGATGKMRRITPSILHSETHQIISHFNREPFVSNAAAAVVRGLEERVPNLVSLSSSVVDQSIWERAAAMSVDDSSDGTTAEVDLCSLVRYFAGILACEVLMGQDFVANNPDIVSDLYTHDSAIIRLVAGFPRWLPGMQAGYSARSRLLRAVAEHQEALYAIFDGRDPGSKWGDMSDVSSVMKDRARAWRKLNVGPEVYGPGDLALLMAMNANANQLVFWLLQYIYKQPTLHSEILRETAPFVKQETVKSELPIQESPRLSINLDGLLRNCPLIKAAYFETLRLESAGLSVTSVTETFTVTESAKDAALEGKSQPQTYIFQRGSKIMLPYNVHGKDERYFKDPKLFNPRRFLTQHRDDGESLGSDQKPALATTVTMGTLQVFGGGANMCKGRNFAEREVLAMAAAILTVWDIRPIRGGWPEMGRTFGPGAFKPTSDVRVRIKKREAGAG